jgi:hypothetical protein
VDDSELADALRVLVDDDPPAPDAEIDLSGAGTFDRAQSLVSGHFERYPTAGAVTMLAGDVRVGVATRRSLGHSEGTAAEAANGAGERLELTTDSIQYRLLTFSCSACGQTTHRTHVDWRDLPRCATTRHGTMGLLR